jgi:hypothetical protein
MPRLDSSFILSSFLGKSQRKVKRREKEGKCRPNRPLKEKQWKKGRKAKGKAYAKTE